MGGDTILERIIAQLSELDIQALLATYSLRCMSETLLHRYIYKYSDEMETLGHIRALVELKLFDVIEWKDDQCIFCLTMLGVDVVRKLSPDQLYKINARTGKRVYEVQAKELRPSFSIINHQLHLNELSLMIQEQCGIQMSAYKDIKFASNFMYAQPDGVFELEDYDVFLEMDMGQERTHDLIGKWDHYRNYFSSRDYYLRRNRPIIVLFATENASGFKRRRGTVIKTLSSMVFDLIGSNFNCYIGTSEYCARVLAEIYKRNTFQVCDLFSPHGYVCPEFNHAKETQFLKNSAGQGFYVCSYLNRPINGLKQAIYYEKVQAMHGSRYPLVMVCNSEEEILNDLKACDVLYTPQVYFTTPSRLETLPLNQALFQFDKLGNLVSKGDF